MTERDLENGEGERDLDRLLRWGLHEDESFNNRAGLFTIAEAMLLNAYATLLAGGSLDRGILASQLVAGVGMILSAIWFYMSSRQLGHTLKPIRKSVRELWPMYEKIDCERSTVIHFTALLGWGMPLVFFFLWALLIHVFASYGG